MTYERILEPVTILINTAVSSPLYIHNKCVRNLSVEFPDAWTAADLIVEVNREHNRIDKASTLTAGGWVALRDSTNTIIELASIATAAKSLRVFDQKAIEALSVYPWVRVRSVSIADSTIDTNQTAARTLYLGLIRF